MKVLIVGAAALALAACATPPRPQTRDAWQAQHSRTYEAVSANDLFDAAQQVLEYTDEDFEFQYPPNQLLASRHYMIYAVLALSMGRDYWRFDTRTEGDSTQMTLRITRAAGSTAPSPTMGLNGQIGAGVNSVSAPGREIFWAAPYHMFFARMDYILGRKSDWLTCDQAKMKYPKDFGSGQAGVMCGLTTENKTP